MGAWENYSSRMSLKGASKRAAAIASEKRNIGQSIIHNPSYTTVDIYPAAYGYNISDMASYKITQSLSVINTSVMSEKTLITMPGEDVDLGALVSWMSNYWLVTERDVNTTIYTKAKMVQCNHLLQWIDDDSDDIISQWCVIGDASTSIGESMDSNKMTTYVDSKISMAVARNDYTVAFRRNKRFLIDDEDAPHKMAYELSRPLKVGSVYNSKGVLNLTLQEVTATEDDEHELGLADYYAHFQRNITNAQSTSTSSTTTTGRRMWM